jgi:hypothetical protein
VGRKTYSPVARTEITRLRRDLDALIARCEHEKRGTDTQSDLYQYACVRLCGFLEQSLLLVGRARMSRQLGGEAQTFGLSHLSRLGRSPTDDAILKYVGRFSPEWSFELTEWLAIDSRASTVNSLVGIRRNIAHGSSVDVSSQRFAEYYVVILELVEWLIENFEALPRSPRVASRG